MSQFTKQVRWQTAIDVSAVEQPPSVLFGNNLYLGLGSKIVVLDRFTGDRLPDISSRASGTNPGIPTIDPGYLATFGGKLVVGDSTDNTVIYVVVDESTSDIRRLFGLQGRLQWLRAGGQGSEDGPRPYDAPGLFGATTSNIFHIAKEQRRYQIVNQTDLGSISAPIYSDGTLYGLSSGLGVYAYSFDSFNAIWTNRARES